MIYVRYLWHICLSLSNDLDVLYVRSGSGDATLSTVYKAVVGPTVIL